MAYGNRVKTDALTTTYGQAVYPLGTVFVESADEVRAANASFPLIQGDRTWVFVRAAVAVVGGDLVKRNAVTTPFEGAPNTTNEGSKFTMIGVAAHAIGLNQHGWIVKKGAVGAKVEGSVAAGDLLASDGAVAAGTMDTLAPGAGLSHTIIGIALDAEGAVVAGYSQAVIDIP